MDLINYQPKMEDSRTKEVKVLEITDPWDFLVIECPSSQADGAVGGDAYSDMLEKMNVTLETIMEQGTVSHRPTEGEICATLSREDGRWHRVRVDSWLVQNRGQYARCYLIDSGCYTTASVQRLMKLPSVFADFPSQVMRCGLWGVQPVTLKLEECDSGITAQNRPCGKWDLSATLYMRKRFDTPRSCRIQVVSTSEDKLEVLLFYSTKQGPKCFNDALVDEEYAVKREQGEISKHGSPHRGTDLDKCPPLVPETAIEQPRSCGKSNPPPLVSDSSYKDEQCSIAGSISAGRSRKSEELNPPPLVSESSCVDQLYTCVDNSTKRKSRNSEGLNPPPLVSESSYIDTGASNLTVSRSRKSEGSNPPPLVSESSYIDEQYCDVGNLEAPVTNFFKQYLSSPEQHYCTLDGSRKREEPNPPPLVSESGYIEGNYNDTYDQQRRSKYSNLPPLVSEVSYVDEQYCDVGNLEPPVANFFKQCLSSPETMPPLMRAPSQCRTSDSLKMPPLVAERENENCDSLENSLDTTSCHSVPPMMSKGLLLSPPTAVSSMSTKSPTSVKSPQSVKSQLSSSLASSPQSSAAISKMLMGRGRAALLFSPGKKPGLPNLSTSQRKLDFNNTSSGPKEPETTSSVSSQQQNGSSDTKPKALAPKQTNQSLVGVGASGSQTEFVQTSKVLASPKKMKDQKDGSPRHFSPPCTKDNNSTVLSPRRDARSSAVSSSPYLGPMCHHPGSGDFLSHQPAELLEGRTAARLLEEGYGDVAERQAAQSDGGDSVTSPVSGTRTRFRKSGDDLIIPKSPVKDADAAKLKIATLLGASGSELRDDNFRQLRGQLKGKELLQSLRESSGQLCPRSTDGHPNTVREDQPVPQPILGVLANGKGLPVLTVDVVDVPFDAKVKQVLMGDLRIKSANSIQAYIWPAALMCRHVVGVCPPQKGKTMSYVPVLVSMLRDKMAYVELPPGKGPLAMIVVPTWRKARDVYEMIQQFIPESSSLSSKRIRSLVLYAGGTESNEALQIALIAGCEILVATPASILRVYHEDFTSFKRLCHIVLDDADILSARFASQVDEIMQLYRLVFKDRRHQAVPRQVMLFASQWTDGLDSFRQRYTREPIIALSSRVEASIYGAVKQVVAMSAHTQRLSTFCSLLDSMASTDKRVAAFTTDIDEAVAMWKGAKSRGVYCLLVHHDIPLETVAEVREQWLHSSRSKQFIVVVCTDSSFQDLAITNATDVIHYGLPDSKTKFGNRLACMLDYFRDRTDDQQELEIQAISHVILTEKCGPRAEQLYSILQRCPSERSQQLNAFLRGYKMTVETDERIVLCPLLKAFGTCIAHDNQEKCIHRHIVLPHRDFRTGEFEGHSLPDEGQVTIQVVHVVTAGRYFCHLKSYKAPGDTTSHDLRLTYVKLAMDVTAFYAKTSNHVPYLPSDDPFHDGLCAFKDEDGVFARAKVMWVRDDGRSMKEVKVWLVDQGFYKIGTVDQLVALPRRLAEVPYQAVEVFLCCVKPMDEDREWTDKADMYIHYLVEGKDLVGRIMLRAGLTLWLMPLVHQVQLRHVGMTSDVSLRQELLEKKFAVRNPDHMKLLYELFRGKTRIPEILLQQYYEFCLEIELTQETLRLPEKEEFSKVIIAAVTSPSLFYVQRDDTTDKLARLESEIEATVNQASDDSQKIDAGMKLERGSVCLALSADGRWYRAKLVSDCVDDRWEAFFLDYGDREWLPLTSLRGLPRSLGLVPCQAIECELAYVEPLGDEWSQEAPEVMFDLSYFANEEKKLLFAKVVDTKDSVYGLGQKLVVDVYETVRENVRFSHELVKRHEARVSDSDGLTKLKPILGKPALKSQKFFNPLDKIPFCAANLYWSEESSDALQLAEEIKTLLSLRMPNWDASLEQRGVLPSIIKIVGYVKDVTAHGIMLQALARCCMQSERLCLVAVEAGLLERLSCCLEQKREPEFQKQAAKAIALLVVSESFCVETLESSCLMITMEQLLGSHSEENPLCLEVLKDVCSSASQLVASGFETESLPCLCSSETIDDVMKAVTVATTDEGREPWLELLAAISQQECTHAYLMRRVNITVVLHLISTSHCPKGLYYLLSLCLSLAEGSRKHKTELLEYKLLIMVNSLLEKGLQSPALEIGLKLKSAMSLRLPEPEVLAGVPADNNNTVDKKRCPEVLWSQNCFRVVLKVKVRDARPENFRIMTDMISCRVQSESTLYTFDWELYDCILPDECRIETQPSKTVISLKKATKGQWNRLCKEKQKIFSLKPDLDLLYNSDSDAEVEDDEDLTKLTRKKLCPDQLFRTIGDEPKAHFDTTSESEDFAVYSDDDNNKDFL